MGQQKQINKKYVINIKWGSPQKNLHSPTTEMIGMCRDRMNRSMRDRWRLRHWRSRRGGSGDPSLLQPLNMDNFWNIKILDKKNLNLLPERLSVMRKGAENLGFNLDWRRVEALKTVSSIPRDTGMAVLCCRLIISAREACSLSRTLGY